LEKLTLLTKLTKLVLEKWSVCFWAVFEGGLAKKQQKTGVEPDFCVFPFAWVPT